jgi:hypothetical protein
MIEGVRSQRQRLLMKLPMILMLASFSGCASTSRCPPLVDYSKEDQAKAAKELRALPNDSAIARLVQDYGQLRRTCRL